MANMYTKDAGVAGYCTKEKDNVSVKVKPLRNDVVIESADTYKLDESTKVAFTYSDALGNRYYFDVDVNIYKNLFDR